MEAWLDDTEACVVHHHHTGTVVAEIFRILEDTWVGMVGILARDWENDAGGSVERSLCWCSVMSAIVEKMRRK